MRWTGTFRLSVIFSCMCLLAGFVLFEVINWRTRVYEHDRITDFVLTEAAAFTQGTQREICWMIQANLSHSSVGLHQPLVVSALIDQTGKAIVGNLDRVPDDLPVDGKPHEVVLAPQGSGTTSRSVVAVAERLAGGDVVVVGRGLGVVATLRDIVMMALLPGAIWLIVPALGTGLWSNHRARVRLTMINQAIGRIMRGDVAERLPVGDDRDAITLLTVSVNQMLAEIERLLIEAQGVSDAIAHDLRTPLARVRMILERGRDKAKTLDDLVTVSDRAIGDLDQAQTIITALLRIGDIQSGQRRSGFQMNDLNQVIDRAAELYRPIAEERGVTFTATTPARPLLVSCDRDLMVEVAANLLDNAIKFAPVGGEVEIRLSESAEGPVLCVGDNGPGIPYSERTTIMGRFQRLPQAHKVPGTGLGLSIVHAVALLHGFPIEIKDRNPGSLFILKCWVSSVTSQKTAAKEQKRVNRESRLRPLTGFV
jgi:signal transduction histidine kinase